MMWHANGADPGMGAESIAEGSPHTAEVAQARMG